MQKRNAGAVAFNSPEILKAQWNSLLKEYVFNLVSICRICSTRLITTDIYFDIFLYLQKSRHIYSKSQLPDASVTYQVLTHFTIYSLDTFFLG